MTPPRGNGASITAPNVALPRTDHRKLRAVERDVDEFTQSFEVAIYTDKAAKQLQDARSQFLECKQHLGLDSANATVAEELEILRAPLAEAFGADAWFLAKNPVTGI